MSAIAHQALEILDRDPLQYTSAHLQSHVRCSQRDTPAPIRILHSLQRDPPVGTIGVLGVRSVARSTLATTAPNPDQLPRMSTLCDLSQHRIHSASKPHTGVKKCGGSCIKRRCRNVRVSRVRNAPSWLCHADKLAQAKLAEKHQRQAHKQQLQDKKAAKEQVRQPMLTSLLCRLTPTVIWQHSNMCTTQHAHHDFKMLCTLYLRIALRGGKAWADLAPAEQHVLCKQGPTFIMLSEGAVGREGGHAAHSPAERGLQACEGRGTPGEGLCLTWSSNRHQIGSVAWHEH